MTKDKFRHFINSINYTPEAFAEKIGVGKSGVYKILRGDTKKISFSLAEKINQSFPEYSIEYFLEMNNITENEFIVKGDNKIEVQKVVDIVLDNIELFKLNEDFKAFLDENTLKSLKNIQDQLE